MSTRMVIAGAMAMTGVAAASGASAACSVAALDRASNNVHTEAFAQFAGGIRAAQEARAATANANLPNFNAPGAHGSIVGFWKFAFTAPDGVTGIDWGFQQWHSDGTELTNSGGQLPATGNFCTGVWQQFGRGAYQLNHWAIAWNLPGTDPADLAGLVNIRELVSVDGSGDSMTGSVSLDLYALDGTTLLAHLGEGTVSGERITP
jgi:hypothetical protein